MEKILSVYFVTSVHYVYSFIISSTHLYHENENKQTGMDVFDFQEIKRMGQSFYILTFFIFLILAADIDIYLSLVIINWQYFKIVRNHCQTFASKTV